jgi:lysozyme
MRPLSFAARIALSSFVALAPSCAATDEPAPGERSDEELATDREALVVCPEGEVVRGIDVSVYQGDIDWPQVAAAGYRYAIARVSHSTTTLDTKFAQNWAGIASVGMVRGVYQYFQPTHDTIAQAQVVCDAVGLLGPGDLPAVIDVEVPNPGISPSEYADVVRTWIDHVEACTGKPPMIYTGKYYWEPYLGTDEFADHPLWHAAYPTACQPPNSPPSCGVCPNIADQWSTWTFWQYTDKNSIPGISGNVDTNLFNGDEAALAALAAGGAQAAELVELDAPKTVLAGERFVARFRYENVGAKAWDGVVRLATTEPRDRECVFFDEASWISPSRVAGVAEAVAPGEEHVFEVTLLAPDAPGTYTEHFGLVDEDAGWFADAGGPPDTAARLVLQVLAAPEQPAGAGGGGGGTDGAGGASDDGNGDAAEAGASCDCGVGPGRASGGGGWGAIAAGLLGYGVAGVRAARRRARRAV